LKAKANHTKSILRPHHPHLREDQHHHSKVVDTGRQSAVRFAAVSSKY